MPQHSVEVELTGERTRADRDAELRATAVDIDSEEEAVGGGVATEAVPIGSFELSQNL